MNEHLKLLDYLEQILTPERKVRFLEILSKRTKHLTIAVEDVYQRHNASALLRSCDIFGVQEAHIIEFTNEHSLDKNIAMGAEQWVDVHNYNTTTECIDSLKANGYQIIATTPNNDSCMVHDFDITKKSALFFGTELTGLSNEVITKADGYLKIPMVGFTQSLNVSVSAAIILQTLATKVRDSTVDWQLSEDEIIEKRVDWTKKSIQSIDAVMRRYEEINK